MSIQRWAARVDATKAEIVNTLRRAGFYVYDLKMPVDLLVARDGKMHLVECKRLEGKKNPKPSAFTSAQEKFMAQWPGPKVVTVTSGADALERLGDAALSARTRPALSSTKTTVL